jgi:hypothetical protein
MFGTLISDGITCIMISYMGLVLIYFGGGPFFNYLGDENLLQSFFMQISPFRYASEQMTRIMLNGVEYKNFVLEQFDFVEEDKCYPKLLLFFIIEFSIAWFALKWRSRQL